MPSQATMKAAMQAYIDAFNGGDASKIVALFADDATVEDPLGTPPKKGKGALQAFYSESIKTGAKLTLSAPIRGSHSDAAAMAFEAKIGPLTVRVIDVMTFNEAGKFTSMRAYFGPEDFIQG